MAVFITDLDKTFLKTDLSVGDFSKRIWNETVEKGHFLGVATARSLKKSLDFLQGLSINAPLILLDGAMVATQEGTIVKLRALSRSLADEIVALAKTRFDIEPFIVGFFKPGESERFLYPKRLNEHQRRLIESYKNDNRLRAKDTLRALPYNLKIVYMGEKEEMIALEKTLSAYFGDAIHIKNAPDVYFDCYFLTVLHPLGDKAHALQTVMEYVDRPIDTLTVFGDNRNDIGMFRKADTAVAVRNAVEELKQIADVVLERTNDEEAVAHYLQKVT